jgi:hypothetical protein
MLNISSATILVHNIVTSKAMPAKLIFALLLMSFTCSCYDDYDYPRSYSRSHHRSNVLFFKSKQAPTFPIFSGYKNSGSRPMDMGTELTEYDVDGDHMTNKMFQKPEFQDALENRAAYMHHMANLKAQKQGRVTPPSLQSHVPQFDSNEDMQRMSNAAKFSKLHEQQTRINMGLAGKPSKLGSMRNSWKMNSLKKGFAMNRRKGAAPMSFSVPSKDGYKSNTISNKYATKELNKKRWGRGGGKGYA